MDQDETQRLFVAIMGRLEEQSAMMQGMSHDISKLWGAVTGLREDVTGLKADVSGLKADVAELKSDVALLETDVASLKGEVAELRTELKAFRQETTKRFDGIDGKLEWLTAKVFDHDEVIFHLKRKQA